MYSNSMGRVQSRISDIISKMDKMSGKSNAGIHGKNEQFTLNKTDPLKKMDPDYETASGTFNEHLDKMIRTKSARYGVSEDLIRAVIKTESNGQKDAVSSAGAIGLMQIMPGTAKQLGVNPYNPEENIDGGVKYLKKMAGEFHSLDEVLAAYNAGPGAVKKYGGIPPYNETKNYIKQIRRNLGQ